MQIKEEISYTFIKMGIVLFMLICFIMLSMGFGWLEQVNNMTPQLENSIYGILRFSLGVSILIVAFGCVLNVLVTTKKL